MRTVTVASDRFLDLGRVLSRALGRADLALVVIPHPLAGLAAAGAEQRGRTAGRALLATLTSHSLPPGGGGQGGGASRTDDARPDAAEALLESSPPTPTLPLQGGGSLEVPADLDGFQDEMERRGWGDGLPLVPPTPARVAACVRASGLPGQEVVARLPPSWADATVERVAANAVLAGCRPEHLPVVLAAIRAAAREQFNLSAVQTTTHPCAVLVIAGGPVAAELGISGGHGAFGPGSRANATIGRAVRLVLMNVGGARPGILDRATQGTPAKYTYCVAENEAGSPWEPLRVSLGFDAADSVVTVVAGEAPHNVNDHGSTTAASLVRQIAGTLAVPGSNNAYMKGDSYLFLGPEHARQLAAEGLGRADVQRLVFESARIPRERFGPGQLAHIEGGFGPEEREMTSQALWVGRGPEDIRVLVVGGDGRHSCWVPTFGMSRSCSEVVVRG